MPGWRQHALHIIDGVAVAGAGYVEDEGIEWTGRGSAAVRVVIVIGIVKINCEYRYANRVVLVANLAEKIACDALL